MNVTDKVKQLREQADRIEAALEEGEAVTISVGSGRIWGRNNIPEEDVLSFTSEFAYSTQSNGDAYKEVCILAGRDCGSDAAGRKIIRLRSGRVVYYSYYPGDAASFDSGVFTAN